MRNNKQHMKKHMWYHFVSIVCLFLKFVQAQICQCKKKSNSVRHVFCWFDNFMFIPNHVSKSQLYPKANCNMSCKSSSRFENLICVQAQIRKWTERNTSKIGRPKQCLENASRLSTRMKENEETMTVNGWFPELERNLDLSISQESTQIPFALLRRRRGTSHSRVSSRPRFQQLTVSLGVSQTRSNRSIQRLGWWISWMLPLACFFLPRKFPNAHHYQKPGLTWFWWCRIIRNYRDRCVFFYMYCLFVFFCTYEAWWISRMDMDPVQDPVQQSA